jgi:hypothetical protein
LFVHYINLIVIEETNLTMSIPVYYGEEFFFNIPKWVGQSKQTFLNGLNCLNIGTVKWSLDEKVIFITEMTNFYEEPINKYDTPYITVLTCYGKLFIPARSKSVGDMQKAINWFQYYNPDSVFIHDTNTMEI